MALIDKLAGLVLVALSAAIFAYYSAWVFVTPYLPAEHELWALFPFDYEVSYIFPAVLLVVGLVAVTAFVSVMTALKSCKRRKRKDD